MQVTYYPGGYDPNAPAHNAAEIRDPDNNVHIVYDAVGNVVVREPLQPDTATLASANQPADLASIRAKLQTALATNKTFLALGSPTQAQAVAQVAALTRQMNGVFRVLAGLAVDSTDT